MLKLMDMVDRLLITHPPKNLLLGIVICKYLDICRCPATAANNGYFIFGER